MGRLLLFDTINTGHRLRYNQSLIKGLLKQYEVLYVTKTCKELERKLIDDQIDYRFINTKFKYFLLHDLSLLLRAYSIAYTYHIKRLHILYLDSLLILLLLTFPIMCLLRLKISGTLHWYPSRSYKKTLLRILIRFRVLDNIVVHGEYTKNKVIKLLDKRDSSRVISIVYPNLHEIHDTKIESVQIKGLDESKFKRPYFLLFGGLRYDKGIDILLEAMKLIKEKQFTVLIVGKEEYYTKEFIEHYIKQYKLVDKIYLNLEYVPEHEVPVYFNKADSVILPYRKIFSGQSGPLTEGVANSKFIIGPNRGELGYTIKHYNLGFTFESEDSNSLSEKMNDFIYSYDLGRINVSSISQYKQEISVETFAKKYQNFFLKEV
ncbi:glycosyltransferase family 4 protein [Paenibacillus alkalitolerans]|uniref:glycosyltransferase family 4 protein n=1 Tax=Paenibacillus alkalitolerans TaxID=2799335 RepID=UPI0018F6BF67|nr:glycosyltransferase family 4 protein [Paenibacillus alkalitolerans]